jgi:hypothetical protein
MSIFKQLIFRTKKANDFFSSLVNFNIQSTIDGTTNNFNTKEEAQAFVGAICTDGSGAGAVHRVVRIPLQVGDTVYDYVNDVPENLNGWMVSNLIDTNPSPLSYCHLGQIKAKYIYHFSAGVVLEVVDTEA